MPAEFNPHDMLRVLLEHEVEFIVIGGFAAVIHGSPLPTLDLDITPLHGKANLGRLSAALSDLKAMVRAVELDEPLPFGQDADSLGAAQVWNLRTLSGDLDISFVPTGTTGYHDLRRDAAVEDFRGLPVLVASLADVIRSKEAAGRDKDRRVLPVLREILARRLHEKQLD